MRIAAIIVNYGTADLAIAAVESLRSHAAGVEIHLVDNASPTGDAAVFEAEHAARGWGAEVTLWPSGENLGFGRGNNLVLDRLLAEDDPPEAVFLLNPDARVRDGTVDALARALEATPRAAAAGAAISAPDGAPQVAAFRFPGLKNSFLRTANFGPLDRMFASPPPAARGGPVDWVSGAAVMLRLRALKDVGCFDPGFFLYFEEVELMHRLTRAGWIVLHVPEARVIHAEGAATGGGGQRRDQPAYLYDSWRHYRLRTGGRAYALLAAALMLPAAALNVAHRRLRGQDPTIPRRFFRDHTSRVILPLLTGLLTGRAR